eukprot:494038_1
MSDKSNSNEENGDSTESLRIGMNQSPCRARDNRLATVTTMQVRARNQFGTPTSANNALSNARDSNPPPPASFDSNHVQEPMKTQIESVEVKTQNTITRSYH